jgi:hypothetical protein
LGNLVLIAWGEAVSPSGRQSKHDG